MFDARNYSFHDYVENNLKDYYIDNGEIVDDYCIPVIQQLNASFSRLYMSAQTIDMFCIWCDWSRKYDAGWLSELDNSQKEYDECRDYYLKKAGVV